MNAITSKISSKAQTVIPREVREKLGLKTGDTLRYRYTEAGVVIERDVSEDDDAWCSIDPETFWEWGTAEDEAAFAHLQPKKG